MVAAKTLLAIAGLFRIVAFAVFSSPYPPKPYPPDQTPVVGGG